jgi:beta-galactosidase
LPYLIGASLWTFNDYRSNYNGTREFSENRSWGVVDVYRRKKRAYYSIRKEHAPVKDLTVKMNSDKGAQITIFPRSYLDLPSYVLHDYKLVWEIKNLEGEILEAGWENLPQIDPGTNNLERSITWKTEEASQLKVLLLTPQNDNVIDTAVYFSVPKIIPPLGVFGGRKLQNDIRPKSATIRVFLDTNPTAVFHSARIKVGNEIKEYGPSYENFLDLNDLEFSTPYQVEVFAVNPAGETLILKETIEVDPKKINPPAIQHIETVDKGFFVGYATEVDDFQFEVRFASDKNLEGKKQNYYNHKSRINFNTCRRSEKPYFFQIRRVKDNNYYSEWSPVYDVPFDEVSKPKAPKLLGVTRQNKGALVHFEPIKKAIGYELEYRAINKKDAQWFKVSISKSLAHYVYVEGLNPKSTYEFRISAITQEAKSTYSQSIKK